MQPRAAVVVRAHMTAIDERCVWHGGALPAPAPACPDCGPGTTAPGTGGSGTSGGPAGPPPLLEYDPAAITAAATGARSAADGLQTAVTSRAGGLATATGELRLVGALAAAALAGADRVSALSTDVSALSDNLGLALLDYARADDDVAVALDSLLTV